MKLNHERLPKKTIVKSDCLGLLLKEDKIYHTKFQHGNISFLCRLDFKQWPELGIFEWRISGLMLDPLFKLISRLNKRSGLRISPSKVFIQGRIQGHGGW